MSVNIAFYHFTKKPNSTKLPTNSDVHRSFACELREGCSLLYPTIILESQITSNYNKFQDVNGDDTTIFAYNYAYIQNAGMRRYYFIDNVTYASNKWYIQCSVDLLGTYSQDILSSTQYVSRSASNYDSYLSDNIYPTKVYETSGHYFYVKGTNPDVYLLEYNPTDLTTALHSESQAFAPGKSITSGCYVIGVVSNSSSGLRYYLLNRQAFCNFLSACFQLVPSNTGLQDGLSHILFDYAQYIKFCRWYPLMPTGSNLGTSVTSIVMGGLTVSLQGDLSGWLAYGIDSKCVVVYDFVLGIPQNKFITAGLNDYLKYAPYSQYNLYFPPLGNIPLDSTKLLSTGGTTVRLRMWIDLTTGSCQVQVIHRTTSGEPEFGIVYTGVSNWGVEFPIYDLYVENSKVKLALAAYMGSKFVFDIAESKGLLDIKLPDFTKMDTPAFNTQSTLSSDLSLGDIKNDIVETVENVTQSVVGALPADALAAAFGQIQSFGNPDSFLAYRMGDPFIYAYFYKQVDRDIARFGAPLEQSKVLNTLTGFCKCRNSVISSFSYASLDHKPLAIEIKKILQQLDMGFYIE